MLDKMLFSLLSLKIPLFTSYVLLRTANPVAKKQRGSLAGGS